MPYDVGKDPYLDPNTGILRNLRGIVTQADLDTVEADMTSGKMAALLDGDGPFRHVTRFDATLLREVHRQLFGELYDWAGRYRSVQLTKGATSFARAEHLASSLDDCMVRLAAEGFLAGLDHEAFVERLAHYYGELTVLHPFREGNGRTVRTFLSLLAAHAGWHLAWDKMDPAENVAASIAAYRGDETALREMLGAITVAR